MKKLFVYSNFGTPDIYPDYTAHSGQVVEVVRDVSEELYPDEEYNDKMFLVRAADGWEGYVWESELQDAPEYTCLNRIFYNYEEALAFQKQHGGYIMKKPDAFTPAYKL